MSRTAEKQCTEQDCKPCKTAKEMGMTNEYHCAGFCQDLWRCQNCAHAKTDVEKFLCNTYCSGGTLHSCLTKCVADMQLCKTCKCNICDCSFEGSTSEICNDKTKQCLCKHRFITGSRCDTCKPNFINFPTCHCKFRFSN